MRPADLPRYVALVTDRELDKDTVKNWYAVVRATAPYGVVDSINSIDDKGVPSSVSLVHRESEDDHYYMVPLLRDLTEGEGEKIVNAFAVENPDLDFDVTVTVICAPTMTNDPKIEVAAEKYASLCAAWAKKQHEDWVRSRTSAGWRFGQTMDMAERTHPLLRPWEELPDEYRKVDLEQPQMLVDLLNQQGYTVVSTADLEAVLRVVRQLGK